MADPSDDARHLQRDARIDSEDLGVRSRRKNQRAVPLIPDLGHVVDVHRFARDVLQTRRVEDLLADDFLRGGIAVVASSGAGVAVDGRDDVVEVGRRG